jgi:cobalt-zinc-cadmium efflux system protein
LHDHSHAHHGHHHAPESFGRAFAIVTALNLALVAGQVVYGLIANSLALLADAGHNFGDVVGLLLAWLAFAVARWKPSEYFTYRLRSASILAAFANGVLLLVATVWIAWEAVQRFAQPQEVATGTVIVLATLGVAVNGLSAIILSRGRKADLNMHGAYLHMVADAGVSVAVVAAGLGIWWTGWQWLDPAVSLGISAVILAGTWGLLRDSLRLALGAAPRDVDPARVRAALAALPGVTAVHDLHIWAMSTTETALTCHLVMPGGHPGDGFLRAVAQAMQHDFGIGHTTVQVEFSEAAHLAAGAEAGCDKV